MTRETCAVCTLLTDPGVECSRAHEAGGVEALAVECMALLQRPVHTAGLLSVAITAEPIDTA